MAVRSRLARRFEVIVGLEVGVERVLELASSFRLRRVAIFRSRSLSQRQRGSEGESGSQYQVQTAMIHAGKPSSKNNSLQLAMPVLSPNLTIPYAKLLAYVVARGAAAMKIPVLNASSSRL